MTSTRHALLPELTRHDDVLTWAVPEGWYALSSAAVGGGLVRPRWVLNATVDGRFARTDLDAWAAALAERVGLDGLGCALLTAADVGQVEHAHRDGVDVWATVGVTRPTWAHGAASPEPGAVLSCHTGRGGDHRVTTGTHEDSSEVAGRVPRGLPAEQPPRPGTVNVVVSVPVPLTPSALVQAVGTLTEAKAQVLVRAGVPGTGTASDAVVVMCPGPDAGCATAARTRAAAGDLGAAAGDLGAGASAGTGAQVPFAGVRSTWGRRVAHAVHDAVLAGLAAHPWVPDPRDPERVW